MDVLDTSLKTEEMSNGTREDTTESVQMEEIKRVIWTLPFVTKLSPQCASWVSRQSTEASLRQGRFLSSHPSWSGWVDFILVLWGLYCDSLHTGGVDQDARSHGARK